MNTRNRSGTNYNNSRSSGRFNTPGQFVSAGELAPAASVQTTQYDYYQQPESQTQVNYLTKPKNEPTTPTAIVNTNLQQLTPLQNTDVEMNESADGLERPKWMKSKLQGGVKKVPNKERRRRQNQTLRRLLTPKNALMVLNEMMPNQQVATQFKVEPSPLPQHYYTKSPHTFAAELTLDGSNYKAYGENKMSARNACAELAIRDIIIRKMNKVMASDGASTASTEGAGGAAGAGGAGGEGDEESLPMLQLASFALHKLFTEWEYDGHKVPQLKPQGAAAGSVQGEAMETGAAAGAGAGAGARPAGKAPKPPRTVPSNAAAMHPCMLLTYLRPNVEYRELDAQGDKPQNMTYTAGVTVDGVVYSGTAPSKKEARKEAARAACQELFKVTFDAQITSNTPIHN